MTCRQEPSPPSHHFSLCPDQVAISRTGGWQRLSPASPQVCRTVTLIRPAKNRAGVRAWALLTHLTWLKGNVDVGEVSTVLYSYCSPMPRQCRSSGSDWFFFLKKAALQKLFLRIRLLCCTHLFSINTRPEQLLASKLCSLAFIQYQFHLFLLFPDNGKKFWCGQPV